MSDIFDEVEKLLEEEKTQDATDVNAGPALALDSVVEDEAQFNDSELEDIMAEIESLESDFETVEMPTIESSTSKESLAFDSTVANKTDLQKEIEKEIAMIDQNANTVAVTQAVEPTIIEDVVDEVAMSAEADDDSQMESAQVLNLERKVEVIPMTTNTKSEMSFTASGNMNLNLTFNVGSEKAQLFIDEVKGLVVSMNGVELCLNETNGCTVTMENGINFNIPLTNKDSSSKKKVA